MISTYMMMVMYMMMHDTHVHEGDPVGCGSATKIERIELLFAQLRMIARRCARDVASFMIIAARTAKLIRTIIEITGYPAPKEIAPPTPALRSIEARPLLSAAIGARPSRNVR